MFENCGNTKKKGDAGLGTAIAHFTMRGVPVSIPLTDSQDYDLVIELETVLQKVQVKTTEYCKKDGKFEVGLRLKGGNSKVNLVSKQGTDLVYDYLFVLTGNGDTYFIPKTFIQGNRSCIVLGPKFDPYRC